MPHRSILARAALNFYLAAIECENYGKVYTAFESRGLSTVGAMQFRLAHHGSIKTCCDIIQRRYGTEVEEQWEELRGRSAVPSCSVDIGTCMTSGEWKDPHGTKQSTEVETSSAWECTGTLEEHAEISRELLTELEPRYKSPRERRRESRGVAEDIEQIRLLQGLGVSELNDFPESFSNTKTKRFTDGHSLPAYDRSEFEDHTESEISKEQRPKLRSPAGLDRAQTTYNSKWKDRFDSIPAGNRKATVDKEYCEFSSIQDYSTKSELALNDKTNRQLSVKERSHQANSENRESSKRLKRPAKKKSGVGRVQQCDRETGIRRSAGITQRELLRDLETQDLDQEQQCSGAMLHWQCEACTLVNKPTESICRACNCSRNCEDDKPLKTGGRQCNQCTFVNSSVAQKCEICESDLMGSSTYV